MRHLMSQVEELLLSIKAAQRELDRRDNELMRPLGLTAGQADALLVIGRLGPVALKELGALLIAESGHPSRLVDRLVAAGLVERVPAPGDRRRVALTLTGEGRRLERRVARVRARAREQADAAAADRDLGPALDVLRELLSASPLADVIARRLELLAASDR